MPRGIRRRRTNRSGGKTTRRPKHRLDISLDGVHPLVKEHWDKTKTLHQNYAKLGLVANLKGLSGGTGKEAVQKLEEESRMEKLKKNVEFRRLDETVEQVEPSEQEMLNPPIDFDKRTLSIGYKIHNNMPPLEQPKSEIAAQVIEQFEKEASNTVPAIRFASHQETLVFTRLLAKYGEDFEAMARDRKLNEYQLTAGQLRRKMQRAIKQ
ncbi:ribosome biogenesis protein Nop16 [Gorgonomyces haynaldii]|nr:ribosome biogenesis protein Nop16 [Gorgonomyces haynaldii]